VITAPLSEQHIRQYLLGELSEQEQVEIEDRAFADQEVLQEVQAVEQELIDDYVSGDIPEQKRSAFETHFLASAERRKKVAFARSLAAVVNETPSSVASVEAAPSWRDKLAAFFSSPSMAYSFAAVSLLLFVVGSWLVVDRIRLRSELAQLRSAQESQLAQNRQLHLDLANERVRNEELIANRDTQSPAPTPEIQPENPQKPTTPTSPVIVAFSLLPGISRGSNSVPQLKIAKDVSLVKLQIGIDPKENYQHYRVVLQTDKGQQVLAQGNLSARGSHSKNIPLTVPASGLRNGRYELTLKGVTESGTTEDVGFYYFDVVKE